MDILRRLTAGLLACTIALTGCAGNSSLPPPADNKPVNNMVGPLPSSAYGVESEIAVEFSQTRLEVIVPVFDPGLSEEAENYEEENVWPELRRAEANRFAYKMKLALEDTSAFGAVRVTPDATATGDLYVKGTILESNGEDVEIRIDVIDITGRVWFARTYSHEVDEGFYKDPRTKGMDPYDPVFQEAATEVAAELKELTPGDLEQLTQISELRFGASLAEDAFEDHLEYANGRTKLRSFPSEDDPMLARTRAIRVRDQLFVDALQANYESFSQEMNDSYLIWQEQSLFEIQAERDADLATIGEIAGGVALIALSVLGIFVGVDLGAIGGVLLAGSAVAGTAGIGMIRSSFQTAEEAKVHRDALQELGESINIDLSPRVVEFEEEMVVLTGDAQNQFSQWRTFLQEINRKEEALESRELSETEHATKSQELDEKDRMIESGEFGEKRSGLKAGEDVLLQEEPGQGEEDVTIDADTRPLEVEVRPLEPNRGSLEIQR